jgi:2-keto-4-pentenoate hydratase
MSASFAGCSSRELAIGLGAAGLAGCACARMRLMAAHLVDVSPAGAAGAATSSGGAADAAQKLLETWLSHEWIESIEGYPAVFNIDEAYAIHAAMAANSLVNKLGGIAGYKMGGLGQIPGVAAAYGPLFGVGIVDAPAGLSVSAFNLFNLEVEIGFVLGTTLAPRDEPFGDGEVWAAVKEVVLSLEICGKRHEIDSPPSNLIGLADCSSAGGVVCGKRFTTAQVTPEQLRDVMTELVVNGESVATGIGSNVSFAQKIVDATIVVDWPSR